ncbi:ATP-dependent RNA helicase DHX30 [Conger conger]|uniref:ATP-dependent RNA helicase DHX30 n=1 Tax=Conger conger TaxID=82655 RepID=UPI002A5AE347|nr:ATP-dependent RNA helicase DHX30 [Conger conger]
MAVPSAALVRLRVLCNLGGKISGTVTKTRQNGILISRCRNDFERRYGTKAETKARTLPNHRAAQKRPGNLKEPKQLLNETLSRRLGVSDLSEFIEYNVSEGAVKRATLTVRWPEMIEVEGFGSRKVEAERQAAAAACQRLRELGVLEPGSSLSGSSLGQVSMDVVADRRTSDIADFPYPPQAGTQGPPDPPRSSQRADDVAHALSLFPKPKVRLAQVIQVATSSSSLRELLQYSTQGDRVVKTCKLTLLWPKEMTFETSAKRKVEAENRAAALACLRLKEMGLLGRNNMPLTHAMYHKQEVRMMGQMARRPLTLELPEHLEDQLADYLRQYPAEEAMQKLWEEEEERAGQPSIMEDEDEVIVDAITGSPYQPLSPEEAELLNDSLRLQWKEADPSFGVELPVDAHRERVVSAVEAERVTIIVGETGCGKTTRIPRFLLESRVHGGDGARCNILVTQPRRISAVSVAHRVAHELGPDLQHCVGYQVRLDSRPPEHSGGAMLFLTVGVLLRKLQSNATLQGVSHVLVDEVHERDVSNDLLLALLRTALQHNPDLRVVLMSATGDTDRLSRYFGGCQVLRVPGIMYPVRQRYLEQVLQEMGRPAPRTSLASASSQVDDDDATPDLDLVADVIEHIHKCGEPGAVLCFLPGWQDIRMVQKILERKPDFQGNGCLILPLHSSMSVSDQQTVFQRPPAGQRKIVLATNIAETSITIDDIVHVVDLGVQKEEHYDPRTKVSCLDTVWISRSNVTQRKGRAGRCQPGHSYHLFPKGRLEAMPDFPIPEILRTPLESLVMQAKVHSPDSQAVDFLSQVIDSPDKAAVEEAIMNLREIGVLDGSESLTPLGERIACLSCDPRLGKVLVLGVLFRCVLPLLSVTACLTRDPFLNSMQNRALIREIKAALSGSSCSDHLVLSRAVQGWQRVMQGRMQKHSGRQYLDDHCLSSSGLRFIQGLTQQFSDNLHEARLVPKAFHCLRLSSSTNHFSQEDQLVKAVLLAGLYPNLIQVKKGMVTKGGKFRPNCLAYRTRTGPVLLHRSTVNRGEENLPSRWLTFFTAVKSNGQVFIRDSTVVNPLSLLLLTDCNITERVSGGRVEVSLGEQSLVRCEMSVQSWKLLWELRMSLHAMLQRQLLRTRRSPDHHASAQDRQASAQDLQTSAQDRQASAQDRQASAQDLQLIALLVQLLNSTEPGTEVSEP